MATHLIKLVTVPRKATRSATTVVEKVTSLASALLRLNQSRATDAVKKDTSPVNAQTKTLVRAVVAVDGAAEVVAAAILAVAAAATLEAVAAVVADKSATSAARSVILLETAPRVEELATAEGVARVVGTAAGEVAVVVVVEVVAKPATPAAASVICLATALRARSVTTVSARHCCSSQ